MRPWLLVIPFGLWLGWVLASTECRWEPAPTPEDVRLCAPASYPGYCLEQLGYKQVCE